MGRTRVLDSSGDEDVDLACHRAVARWRFHPFTEDDRPIRVCTDATITIVLS